MMAAIREQDAELYHALAVVSRELRTEIAQCDELIGMTPRFHQWTQEKHDQYYRTRKIEAEQAARWVFARQMRINPD
jgi:hypothetical protein